MKILLTLSLIFMLAACGQAPQSCPDVVYSQNTTDYQQDQQSQQPQDTSGGVSPAVAGGGGAIAGYVAARHLRQAQAQAYHPRAATPVRPRFLSRVTSHFRRR